MSTLTGKIVETRDTLAQNFGEKNSERELILQVFLILIFY
jgi:hypothetical protein